MRMKQRPPANLHQSESTRGKIHEKMLSTKLVEFAPGEAREAERPTNRVPPQRAKQPRPVRLPQSQQPAAVAPASSPSLIVAGRLRYRWPQGKTHQHRDEPVMSWQFSLVFPAPLRQRELQPAQQGEPPERCPQTPKPSY